MIRAVAPLLLAAAVAGGLRSALRSPAEAGAAVRPATPVAAVQTDRRSALVADATWGDLYVQGQPFLVSVEFTAAGEDAPAELPGKLLEPSAWELDGRPVARRGSDGAFLVQPGQSVRTEFDLAPYIEDQLDGARRDFRLRFVEDKGRRRDVVFLATPEAGIDFMELPVEQLGDYQVVLETSAGLVWLELWPDVAPNHARNFLDLVATGFYDETRFHRVIPGFMVQGGKPREGTTAPRTVDAEFSDRPHVAGVLSAARRTDDVNSAKSEFFIIHRASRNLDGDYSAFGEVLFGMDVVETIVRGAEVHDELIRKMVSSGIEVELTDPRFDFVVNEPNPPQRIKQALVVRASDSRPAERDEDDGR